jgi:fatty acid kinase fatty acid binding subunit
MPVQILTDSTAYFAPGEVEALAVTVVPLYVVFGDDVYRDGVDLTVDQFFQKLVSCKDLPRTSQPSLGDFQQAYQAMARSTDEVVAIHLSSHISGTFNTSSLAAAHTDGRLRVEVVDSKATSLGQTFIVREAAEAARRGAALAEVAAIARAASNKIRTFVAVDTLEFLRRGGRLGRAQALLGGALDVKPILGLDSEGKVVQFGRVRTRRKSLDRLVELACSGGEPRRIAIGDATTPADAEEVKLRMEQAYPGVPVEVGRAGAVIGVHAGPGMLGIQVQEV